MKQVGFGHGSSTRRRRKLQLLENIERVEPRPALVDYLQAIADCGGIRLYDRSSLFTSSAELLDGSDPGHRQLV